jgi:outer membrane autotransporter protein
LNAAPVDIAGETDSKTVGLYVGATAWFEVGGWSLTASGRLNYLMTTISSYEEQGSSILRLRFSESETEALVARGRLRAERRIRLGDNLAVTPSLSAGLISQGAGGDRNRDATFVSTGVPIALDLDDANRMLGESRLGFAFELGDSFEIDAHGAYLNGDGQSGAYGSVTARFRF